MVQSAPTPMMTPEQSYIASVVATYWFVSISMVYLNKALMSSASVSIPAPLFVTWFQCVVTALICYVCGEVGDRMKKMEYHSVSTNDSENDSSNTNEKGSTKSFWHQFPRAEYRIIQGQRVFPLSLVFVGMITFNNLCKYIVYSGFFIIIAIFYACIERNEILCKIVHERCFGFY
jgi:solute carrier family 35 (GDP-fucose transporter), member C1